MNIFLLCDIIPADSQSDIVVYFMSHWFVTEQQSEPIQSTCGLGLVNVHCFHTCAEQTDSCKLTIKTSALRLLGL